MTGNDLGIDFEFALSSLRQMNDAKTQFITSMGGIGNAIADSISYYTGSLADKYREQLASQIGHNSVNPSGGIHGEYSKLNELLYQLNVSTQNQARINGVEGEYANTIFNEEQIESYHNNAWNFEYSSGTQKVNIIEERISAICNNIKNYFNDGKSYIESFLSYLSQFVDSGYVTSVSDDIRTYCESIKSSIEECIIIVDQIINDSVNKQVSEATTEVGSMASNTVGTSSTAVGVQGEKRTGPDNVVHHGYDWTDASEENKWENAVSDSFKKDVISYEYHEAPEGVNNIKDLTYLGKPVVGESFSMSDEYLSSNPALKVGSMVYGGKTADTAKSVVFFADGSYIEAIKPNKYGKDA